MKGITTIDSLRSRVGATEEKYFAFVINVSHCNVFVAHLERFHFKVIAAVLTFLFYIFAFTCYFNKLLQHKTNINGPPHFLIKSL